MLGKIRLLGKFGFQFASAVYLLVIPVVFALKGALDALFPYEAVLCTGLSAGLFYQSGKTVRSLLK